MPSKEYARERFNLMHAGVKIFFHLELVAAGK